MEPINNAERLVLLLRQKLEGRARTSRGGAKTARSAILPAEASGVRALAAADNVDERTLRRAIVQNLLSDQLDPSLINDAQFQQIVTRVTDAIEEDREVSELTTQVLEQIRPK